VSPERECVEFKLAAPDEPKRKRKVGMRADWRPHPDTVKLATQLGIINGWQRAEAEKIKNEHQDVTVLLLEEGIES
jgi:hypothetical protein